MGGGCGTINVPISTEVQARPPRDQTLALPSRVRGRRDSVVRVGGGEDAELLTCPYPPRFRHVHHETKHWLSSLGSGTGGIAS